jgi:hypothetical protein
MKNERFIQVNPDFVTDALYERFNAVKDRRASQIHKEKIDEFVELIADCGTCAGSASEVIDNWLINGECLTYEEIRKRYTREEGEEEFDEENEEQLERIEDYCQDNCLMYSRDCMEACSY